MDIHDGITGFRGAGPHFTFATVEPLMFFRRDCIPRQRQHDCFPTMASVGKRGGAVVNLCWEESIGAKSTSAAQEFAYW
jgi:hypothetical protein